MTDDDWAPGVHTRLSQDGRSVAMRHDMQVGIWRVSAYWPGGHPLTAGPLNVTITGHQEAEEDEAESMRGLTTGALRKIEAALVDSATDPRRLELAGRLSNPDVSIETLVHRLRGRGPRTYDGDYYRDLLTLAEALYASGDRTPNQTIGNELGISVATVKTQLQRARQRIREEGE